MRILIRDSKGNDRVLALGDIAPTVAVFLCGVLTGVLAALLLRFA